MLNGLLGFIYYADFMIFNESEIGYVLNFILQIKSDQTKLIAIYAIKRPTF